jgi:predicted  nucleic acid-binding Zn-ribbon protein
MKNLLLVLPIISLAFLVGCSSKKVDETKPIDQVKTEAQAMSVDDLHAIALKYKDAITAKTQEIKTQGEQIAAKLKDVPITDALKGGTEEIKNLKADLDQLKTSLENLRERFDIYVAALKEKGGSITDLNI